MFQFSNASDLNSLFLNQKSLSYKKLIQAHSFPSNCANTILETDANYFQAFYII